MNNPFFGLRQHTLDNDVSGIKAAQNRPWQGAQTRRRKIVATLWKTTFYCRFFELEVVWYSAPERCLKLPDSRANCHNCSNETAHFQAPTADFPGELQSCGPAHLSPVWGSGTGNKIVRKHLPNPRLSCFAVLPGTPQAALPTGRLGLQWHIWSCLVSRKSVGKRNSWLVAYLHIRAAWIPPFCWLGSARKAGMFTRST